MSERKNFTSEFKSRLTIVEMSYFQNNGDPYNIQSTYYRWIKTDEQPFSRKFKLGTEWDRLQKGWIESASMLHIKNDGNTIIEISFAPLPVEEKNRTMHSPPRKDPEYIPFLKILPKETCRFDPIQLDLILLRSVDDIGLCQITITPN